MDLSTRFLGLDLPHPFVAGASPLTEDVDTARRLADAGASALVLTSLFEEQVVHEELAMTAFLEDPANSFPEAETYLPTPPDLRLGPEEYLQRLERISRAVDVPVIASLNGIHGGHWLDWAREMPGAGARALELNLYHVVARPDESAATIEDRFVAMAGALCASVDVPVAVKLSPFFTSLSSFAPRLVEAGVDGLVLFNRFYQSDIDVDALEAERTLRLSDPTELLLRLRWLAILSSQLEIPLAVTGGVHDAVGAVKAVMAGASAVQVVSVLLKHGPAHLAKLRADFTAWLDERGYESVEQMRGSMNLTHSPDPEAFLRANYIRILQSWHP